MKKKSFIKRTVSLLTVQMLLMITVLLAFLLSFYKNTTDNMSQMLDNFIQIYGNELDNKIENGDRLLEQLVYNNTEYVMLQSAHEASRYYASISLKELLDELMVSENNVDMVVIAENNYQTCINAENNRIAPWEKAAIRAFALECAQKEALKAEWKVEEIGGTSFVYKMYVWHGRVAGVFMKADSFMNTAADSEFENMTVLLLDEGKNVQWSYGNGLSEYASGETVDIKKPSEWGTLDEAYPVAGGNMSLYFCISMSGIRGQIQSSMIGFLAIICCSLLFSILLVRYIKKEILEPMTHMQGSMEQIEDGKYELRIEENYGNREFTVLKDTFNRLMDEIVGLKIKSYEKQIELQETELKCVKLQIRPHFFLNAMTTISSLSMQNRNVEIKTYIDALSKNIRYMFKSGLHTVPLSEEIRHVENYFEMQELKYPGCVFYYIEAEKGTEEWKIPQMLIHTIVENEYKYAVSIDEMLTILIKISKVTKAQEQMLLIEIEDDGKGYPQDVLEQINSDGIHTEKDGSRVGLVSVKRMMELMYERKGLFEISNIIPHGCLNRFYVPERAVHEVQNETVQNEIY